MILNGYNLESEIDLNKLKNHSMDYVNNLEVIQKSLFMNHRHNQINHLINYKIFGHLFL